MQKEMPLFWLASSIDDLPAFPDEVKRSMGYAQRLAQRGNKPLAPNPVELRRAEDQYSEWIADKRASTTMTEVIQVQESSGNVFADLGLPGAEEALAKTRLAQHVAELMARKRLTQVQATAIFGIDQPKVSALLRGRLTGFSTDRLLRFLTALDQDVQIIISRRPHSKKHGRLTVTAT